LVVVSSSNITRKTAFKSRLETLLSQYPKFLLISANHVGSKQLQMIRQSLRGKAEILMGKNTLLRKVLRDNAEKHPNLEGILPYIRGNTGFVFTHMEILEIRSALIALKVQRGAKVGDVSPVDVVIPSGDTRLEPTKTSFFQALGIASKINKGSISLSNEVVLLKAGQRVTPSQACLLQLLNIKPFHYGVKVGMVYDGGSIISSTNMEMAESNLMDSVLKGIANVAAVSLELGYPTRASVMYSMRAALQNVRGVALATGIPLPVDGDLDDIAPGEDDIHQGDEEEELFSLFGDDEEEDSAPAPTKSNKKPQGDDDGSDGDGEGDIVMPMNIFGVADDDY